MRNNGFVALAALVGAATLLAGCAASGPTVRSDYDKAADFGKYRTYGFVAQAGAPDSPGYKSLGQQTAQEAAARQMEARGYKRADNPDLVINFTGKLEEKTDIESVPAPYYGPGWGYGGWYGAPYGGWGGSQVTTRRYNVGTLIMDVVDLQKRQVVFQGGVEGVVTKEMLQNREAAISAAVGRIFQTYPFVAPMPWPRSKAPHCVIRTTTWPGSISHTLAAASARMIARLPRCARPVARTRTAAVRRPIS